MAFTQAANCRSIESAIVSLSGFREHAGSRPSTPYVSLGYTRRNQTLSIRVKSEDTGNSEQVENGKKEQEPQQRKQKGSSFVSGVAEALDFSQTRSEKDANMLEDAREATKAGERMSKEQYGALRRKIGGTYKDFFKDYVEVIGDYVDDGWVDKTCYICKKDASNDPRTKDSRGRYAHVACAEEKKKNSNFFTKLLGGW